MEKGEQAVSKACEVLVWCFEAVRICSGQWLLLLPLLQNVRCSFPSKVGLWDSWRTGRKEKSSLLRGGDDSVWQRRKHLISNMWQSSWQQSYLNTWGLSIQSQTTRGGGLESRKGIERGLRGNKNVCFELNSVVGKKQCGGWGGIQVKIAAAVFNSKVDEFHFLWANATSRDYSVMWPQS